MNNNYVHCPTDTWPNNFNGTWPSNNKSVSNFNFLNFSSKFKEFQRKVRKRNNFF